jgi:hypothetical protein
MTYGGSAMAEAAPVVHIGENSPNKSLTSFAPNSRKGGKIA